MRSYFSFPVLLVIALLIKLEDPKGSILFKQVRVGKNEKEFGMYKFRSMVTDAEERLKDLLEHNEVSGAMFKMKEDPVSRKLASLFGKRVSMNYHNY